MTEIKSPFDPDGVFYTHRKFVPSVPVNPGQHSQFVKYALMDLAQIVPLAYFTPRMVYVLQDRYLGPSRLLHVPEPPSVAIIAYYVPMIIQDKWFQAWIHSHPDEILAGETKQYLEALYGSKYGLP